MDTAHTSCKETLRPLLKALLALSFVALIAWQVPFLAVAEGEDPSAGNPSVAGEQTTQEESPNPAPDAAPDTAPDTAAPDTANAPGPENAHADASVAPVSVSCSGSPDPATAGQSMTWSADASGGDGSYNYSWTGNGAFPSGATTENVTVTYTNLNTFTANANLTVTSGNQTKEASCSVTVNGAANPPQPPPSGECDPSADLIGEDGNPFNPWDGSSIIPNVVADKAHVFVKNRSTTCSYDLNLASYEANAPLGNPPHAEFIQGQTLFDVTPATINPGQEFTMRVDIPPACNYQVDLFVGPFAPQENPDFGALPLSNTHTLLDWNVNTSVGVCGVPSPPPPPPGACVPNPRVDLVDALGNPFNPWDGSSITTGGNGALVTVRNRSSNCSYNVALSSYQTGEYTPGKEQEFIDGQAFFDEDVRQGVLGKLGPGETVTLQVTVPACNWQTDLYSFLDGQQTSPVPPDFALLEAAGTHTLLDWLVDADNGSCIDIPQCPATPTITSAPANTNLTIGSQFSYTATISGGVAPVSVSINPVGPAAPGLIINGTTLSGTVTATGTYTYEVIATSANSPASCAATRVFTITVGPVVQCPATPTITSTPPVTNNVPVGTSYSYTVTTSGGVAPVAVSIVPVNAAPGLVISGATLSGTLTTPGTFSYNVTALSAGSPASCAVAQTITIVVVPTTSCPAQPTITSTPPSANNVPIGSSYIYTVTTSGGTVPITIEITPVTAAPGLSVNGAMLSGTFTTAGSFSYSVTARSAGSPLSCAVSQTITMSVSPGGDDDDDDDDGGGGGGGRRRPNVVLFTEPEIAGASISLAQVPYTGLGTSLLQVFLFIIGLLAISAGIVYGIVRKLRRNAEATAPHEYTGVPSVRTIARAGYDTVALELDTADTYEEYMRSIAAASAPSKEADAPGRVPETRFAGPSASQRIETPSRQSAAPAALERVSTPVSASAAAIMSSVQKSNQTLAERVPEVPHVDPARLQAEARNSRTLVSDDGAALIARSAEADVPAGAPAQTGEKRALERLSQIIDIAKARYPREDGWLILDKDRVRESLFISTLSMIPLFVEWIVRAEDKKVFTFLRMLKHQEQPVADFMRKVVSELDSAHRARLEGAEERAHVNAHIAEVTYHLSNKELESIVAELLHGVDERYDSAYTSVRLSLVRVLDMIKERMLRAVGTPYAFSGERESA